MKQNHGFYKSENPPRRFSDAFRRFKCIFKGQQESAKTVQDGLKTLQHAFQSTSGRYIASFLIANMNLASCTQRNRCVYKAADACKGVQDGSKSLQDVSKTSPGCLQNGSRRPKHFTRCQDAAQDCCVSTHIQIFSDINDF